MSGRRAFPADSLCAYLGRTAAFDPKRTSLASAGLPGTVMLARAEFVAAGGDLDLSLDAPLSGSYTGVDPMGLPRPSASKMTTGVSGTSPLT